MNLIYNIIVSCIAYIYGAFFSIQNSLFALLFAGPHQLRQVMANNIYITSSRCRTKTHTRTRMYILYIPRAVKFDDINTACVVYYNCVFTWRTYIAIGTYLYLYSSHTHEFGYAHANSHRPSNYYADGRCTYYNTYNDW